MPDKSTIEKLLDNSGLAVFIVGIIVFIIGAVGALPIGATPLPVTDALGRVALIVMGLFLVSVGLLQLTRKDNIARPKAATPKSDERGGYQGGEVQWGQVGDRPVPGDYNGDGKAEMVVWRPSDGRWYILDAKSPGDEVHWGESTDVPVPADYDGDGKTEIAVWRPSDGRWYLWKDKQSQASFQWGQTGDIPIPADYDGDGKIEIAVWRPTEGKWYVLKAEIPWSR